MLRTNVATYLINNFRIYTALHYQNSLKKITRPPTQMPPPPPKNKAILYYFPMLINTMHCHSLFHLPKLLPKSICRWERYYRIVCDRNFSE